MDLQLLFDEVKKFFPEVNSKLIPSKKRSFMWSSPITKNIYYNSDQFKEYGFSKIALKGVFAHELSHQIDYLKMGFFTKIFFKFKYLGDIDFKRKVELDADKIAVLRGFGNELIELFKESKNKFDKERYEKRIKPFHLVESEIKSLMRKVDLNK